MKNIAGRKSWYEVSYFIMFDDGVCRNIFGSVFDRNGYKEKMLVPYKDLLAGSIRQVSKNTFRLIAVFTFGSYALNLRTYKETFDTLLKWLKI